ncbi:MAG: phage holin family protein [Candidatus Staskawiczbacteria bacterium]|jgi:putative membrane protein
MIRKVISHIVAGILGLWLATLFISGVSIKVLPDSTFFGIPLSTTWHVIILLGVIIGLLNIFLKPILKTITLPLRIITLGLFSLVINMVLIWAVDLIFRELTIVWFLPLLYTTLIIWALSILIPAPFRKKEK